MYATYSCIPQNTHKFKLIVLSGYDIEKNRQYMLFYSSNE